MIYGVTIAITPGQTDGACFGGSPFGVSAGDNALAVA